MSVDRLILEGIVVECRLGVSEWEQEHPQTIRVDLELAIDAARAAAGDDVEATIDYAQLVTAVKELARRKPYRLLETLADEIASLVLQRFVTAKVFVRVKKRALPGINYAAVEVERLARPAERPPSGWPRSAGREGDRPRPRSRPGSASMPIRRRGRTLAR